MRKSTKVRIRLSQQMETRVPASPADYLDYLYEKRQKEGKR